jgi:hypothetical protein
MKHLKRIAAIVAALILTFGLSAGRISAEPTDATLSSDPSGTQCAVALNGATAISFGTFNFDSATNKYVPAAVGSNTPTFLLTLTSKQPLQVCYVGVSGTELTYTDPASQAHTISANRVSLTAGVASVVQSLLDLLPLGSSLLSVSNVTLSSTNTQLATGLITLGTGYAIVRADLELTGDDHQLPPGAYSGTITFTGSSTAP